MICSKCKKHKPDGNIQAGVFTCNECFLNEKVSKITREKAWKEDWRMVPVLKKHGIRGNMAAVYVKKHPVEFLRRKVWLMRYMLEKNKVGNKWCLMKSLIENGYGEPDAFHGWLKKKLQERKPGDFEVLYE